MKTDFRQRCTGTFYTPLPFAEKALEYVKRHLSASGSASLLTGEHCTGRHGIEEYRLWDAAAGTGNLEHHLLADVHKYCYLSTLEQNDVQTLQTKFPDAAVFQYDYLNGTAEQLPVSLRNDLDNPAIQWLILVNPPYATAQDAALGKKTKDSVANTLVRRQMHADKLGEVSRELYTQFLYRIKKEFKNKKALLGVFAPLKYLVSNNYQKFRDTVFHCGFCGGFVFSSEHFGGTSAASNFPVSFIVWDINDERRIDSQDIVLDVLDENAEKNIEKTGEKKLRFADRSQFLNRWIKRPPATRVFPPFGSALTVKENNKDVRNRIADGFLASMMCPGNELQCQQKTDLLSGPQASAGAFSVVPENFEQAMVIFAARRVPKDNWLQHVDQFLQPNRKLPPEFITDCAVWTLFDSKNQTVALRNVKYQNKVYQIDNHLFPFVLSEVQSGTLNENKESFAAKWLRHRQFSPAARNVLEAGKAVYRLYFRCREGLPLLKYRIETADAGWRQITLALLDAGRGGDELAALRKRHEELRGVILPQLEDYGII